MNVFILGAGFSAPAGMPLGDGLFTEVITYARKRELYESILKTDITSFLEYSKQAKGKDIFEDQINFEEFISYLDIEHLLKLKGSDHWTDEGNESQLVIRNLIALTLHKREEAITQESFTLYEKFVEHLEPGDWIFTFNYDTILEKALKKKGIAYRLFQTRYEDVSFGGGTVAEDTGEIVLLKMHGSIDWFDKRHYLNRKEYIDRYWNDVIPHNTVFDGKLKFNLQPLIDVPYPKDSFLRDVYILEDIDKYFYKSNFVTEAPLIISPSYTKMIYLNPLSEFWAGFNKSGVYEKRVAIIGFSLPKHDEYIRQPLYGFIHNFQNSESPVAKKAKLKMIDLRKTNKDIEDYRSTYNFVNWNKAVTYFDGFNNESLSLIFLED